MAIGSLIDFYLHKTPKTSPTHDNLFCRKPKRGEIQMFFLSFILTFLIQSKQETSVLCAGHWQTQGSCSSFQHDWPSQPQLTLRCLCAGVRWPQQPRIPALLGQQCQQLTPEFSLLLSSGPSVSLQKKKPPPPPLPETQTHPRPSTPFLLKQKFLQK